jgi:pimeloyl-ACP methyl ester carboxylesterase
MSKVFHIEPVMVGTRNITLSGIAAKPVGGPARGLIVALHGGSYSAGYWHYAYGAGLSLLELGAELGFHVLALDRPGYGASHDFDPNRLGLDSQAEFVFDAIDTWSIKNSFDGPVFVIGHSIGGIVSLLMASNERRARLSGIDVLGVPFRFPATDAGAEVNSWSTTGSHVPIPDEKARKWLLFGPDGSFGAEAFEFDSTLLRPMPVAEYRDALLMPAAWPRVLPEIQTPVQFTLAEFEVMQVASWDTLDEVRKLLCNSSNAVVHLQRASGHNASVHWIARAYHMRAVAFFEECLAIGRAG